MFVLADEVFNRFVRAGVRAAFKSVMADAVFDDEVRQASPARRSDVQHLHRILVRVRAIFDDQNCVFGIDQRGDLVEGLAGISCDQSDPRMVPDQFGNIGMRKIDTDNLSLSQAVAKVRQRKCAASTVRPSR